MRAVQVVVLEPGGVPPPQLGGTAIEQARQAGIADVIDDKPPVPKRSYKAPRFFLVAGAVSIAAAIQRAPA